MADLPSTTAGLAALLNLTRPFTKPVLRFTFEPANLNNDGGSL